MLRLLKVPDCADALLKVVEFQRKLFKYAVEHDRVEWDELSNLFGEETKAWLWQQRTMLIDSLINNDNDEKGNFLKFSPEFKRGKYNAFCHDIKFHIKSYDKDFTFQLDGSCQEISNWLINFYEVLKHKNQRGFPKSITGLNRKLNSEYWWESVKQVNKQYTCPICDKLLDETQSIEHFLPKSLYPALSIHPYNLFPSCEKCNNKKGNKDPLASRKIPCSLHPYYHPLEKDSLIHFKINNGKEIIILHPNCHTAKEFTRLFILPNRWNDEMYRSIEYRGYKTLQLILKIDPNAKQIKREQIISRGIDAIKREWGQDSYAYVATQWISEIAPQKWETIIKEVLG